MSGFSGFLISRAMLAEPHQYRELNQPILREQG
jgi:hypothetical protein